MSLFSRMFRRFAKGGVPSDDQAMMMMSADCEKVRRSGSDYIDGETTADQTAQIRAHLDDCVDCSVWMRTLRATVRMLRGLPEASPPQRLAARLRKLTSDD